MGFATSATGGVAVSSWVMIGSSIARICSGVGFGAEPTFKLIPREGLEKKFAYAGVASAPDTRSSAKTVVVFTVDLRPCYGEAPARGNPDY